MIKGGSLGNSTLTGLAWELATNFEIILEQHFHISKTNFQLITKEDGELIDIYYTPKSRLYKYLKQKHKIDFNNFLSKKLYGDEVIVNEYTKSVFIFEKKNQNCHGSVDEKIQTCDFKKKQFEKIFSPIGYQVYYEYLLNDWFKQPQYKDVLDYIVSVNCGVHFNQIDTVFMDKILTYPSKKSIIQQHLLEEENNDSNL